MPMLGARTAMHDMGRAPAPVPWAHARHGIARETEDLGARQEDLGARQEDLGARTTQRCT